METSDKKQGFPLIEMVIVISLILIILVAITGFITYRHRQRTFDSQARIYLEKIIVEEKETLSDLDHYYPCEDPETLRDLPDEERAGTCAKTFPNVPFPEGLRIQVIVLGDSRSFRITVWHPLGTGAKFQYTSDVVNPKIRRCTDPHC
ncbi:MAG: prepilin-type N-terminal cleavage/methylation domain-containing protein [Patescibacteria group bacterium]